VFSATCGDVNSSGAIDIVDALLIAQYYVGLNPSNFDSAAADVNGDSGIDIMDALLMVQYYVGLVDSLPGCSQMPGPGGDGDPYTWPVYSPGLDYNFRDEFGDIAMPTQVLNDCSGIAGTQSQEW